jgi:hypothetical protein
MSRMSVTVGVFAGLFLLVAAAMPHLGAAQEGRVTATP